MEFDPLKEGAKEVFSPEQEGAVAIAEPESNQYNPIEAADRAGAAFDVSQEHNVPLYIGQQLVAGPEPSAFGKAISKIRNYINEKTGLLGYDTQPLNEPKYREDSPITTTFQAGAYGGASAISGLTLTAADVITNKVTGDKNLAGLVARLTGFEPSEHDIQSMRTTEFAGALFPIGTGIGAATSFIPASTALKILLNAGLTFGTTEAAVQFSRNVTEGTPVSWKDIHLASGQGVLWGAGEVALSVAVTGFADSFEQYWKTKDIELSKIKPEDTITLDQQKAIQEAEKIRDINRTKESIKAGNGVPQDLREKYMGVKPEGEAKPDSGMRSGKAEIPPVIADKMEDAVAYIQKTQEAMNITNDVAWDLGKLKTSAKANDIRAKQLIEQADISPKDAEAIYHYSDAIDVHGEPHGEELTPKQMKVYEEYVKPIQDESNKLDEEIGQ